MGRPALIAPDPDSPGPPGLVLDGPERRDDRELRDRCRAALANSGQPVLDHRVQVHVDEPSATPPAAAVATAALIAAAMLTGQMPDAAQRTAGTAVLGEVGLDGSLRPTPGTLPAVHAARAHGLRRVIVPAAALAEASLVDGLAVLGVDCLADIADWLRGDDSALRCRHAPVLPASAREPAPLRALTAPAQRAVTIAAAGGHHLLVDVGTDAGTQPVWAWLHALLPDLTADQQLDLASIQSLTGPREDGAVLVSTPPMVLTHHGEPLATLAGGQAPGAVSRATHGVLVTPELDRYAIPSQETLRAAVLERKIRFAQAGHVHCHPAAFQLVATRVRRTGARPGRAWLALRNAIDISIAGGHTVLDPDPRARECGRLARLLARLRAEVAAARTRAADRWGLGPTVTNALVPHEVLHAAPGTGQTADRVRRAQHASGLTRRGNLAVRLAWTLADLDGATKPGRRHVEQALALRETTPPAAAAR